MGSTFFCTGKEKYIVLFISDLRNLNRQIKHKPYQMPKIQEMQLNLEGFNYSMPLELNMVYYHIRLRTNARNICTIILPWGKYIYKRLPMGVCNSPEILKEKMNKLFQGFKYISVYLNDPLVLTTIDWNDHLTKLETILIKLQGK